MIRFNDFRVIESEAENVPRNYFYQIPLLRSYVPRTQVEFELKLHIIYKAKSGNVTYTADLDICFTIFFGSIALLFPQSP